MPSQPSISVENNFTKGLITEATGLNFPQNACSAADNCIFTLLGDVTTRQGFDYEAGAMFLGGSNSRPGSCASVYKWNNVGEDGNLEIVVRQNGPLVYFYQSSSTTTSLGLSANQLSTVINLNTFAVQPLDLTVECQFADGNGYLFIFHPDCDTIYCTYNAGVITSASTPINIRDFAGFEETITPDIRPTTATAEHLYNLGNQGWITTNPWSANSTTPALANQVPNMSVTLNIGTASGIVNGQNIQIYYTGPSIFSGGGNLENGLFGTAVVTNYTNPNLTFTMLTYNLPQANGIGGSSWSIYPVNIGYALTFVGAIGVYPSNSDVWWYFKNSSGVFAPSTTAANITPTTSQAPQGHYIYSVFNQNKSGVSGQSVTNIVTTSRPSTGCWFQGRIWYSGVNAQVPASGDAPFYNWGEQIYFSTIVQLPSDFAQCYQTNDPTSEQLFSLLPTDGGVISIQGCGSIYKLFPIQNALLVFAANGIWYITGNSGIGFTADDYSIIKLSAVRNISATSIVDVNGLPMFWNEEGIYEITYSQSQGLAGSVVHQNQLEVNPITVGTILTLYNDIPIVSKLYAHGAYHPINYIVQWVYRDTAEIDGVNDRYTYNRVLNYNTFNKAFYTYTIDTTQSSVNGIIYVSNPSGGLNAPDPVFKYLASNSSLTNLSFAEENNTDYVDWESLGSGVALSAYFVTGYKPHGQAQRRFQLEYLYVYSRAETPTSYSIQGLWDFASTGNSGRWSVAQRVNNWNPNFSMVARRHRIRGRGLILQLKFKNIPGQPFDIMGWSAYETINQSP